MSSASEAGGDEEPQFFADGARWDIAVVIAAAAILSGAFFGWKVVAAVLAVPVGFILVAAATLAFIALVMRSVVNNVDDELADIDEENDDE